MVARNRFAFAQRIHPARAEWPEICRRLAAIRRYLERLSLRPGSATRSALVLGSPTGGIGMRTASRSRAVLLPLAITRCILDLVFFRDLKQHWAHRGFLQAYVIAHEVGSRSDLMGHQQKCVRWLRAESVRVQ